MNLSKQILFSAKILSLLFFLCFLFVSFLPQNSLAASSSDTLSTANLGDIVSFGGKDWIVFDNADSSTKIGLLYQPFTSLGKKRYDTTKVDPDHIFDKNNTSSIGYYLNNSFLSSLSLPLSQEGWIINNTWDYTHVSTTAHSHSALGSESIILDASTGAHTHPSVTAKVGLLPYQKLTVDLKPILNSTCTSTEYWMLMTGHINYYNKVFRITNTGAEDYAYCNNTDTTNTNYDYYFRPAIYLRSDLILDPVARTLSEPPLVPQIDSTIGWVKGPASVAIIPATSAGVTLTAKYTTNDVDWTAYTTPLEITAEGITIVKAKSITSAGIESSIVQAEVKIDNTIPIGSMNINGGDSTTSTAAVTLTIEATDSGCGIISKMAVSNNPIDPASANWQAYSNTFDWTLDSTEGEKTVYILFKDYCGNISIEYSDKITLAYTTTDDGGGADSAAEALTPEEIINNTAITTNEESTKNAINAIETIKLSLNNAYTESNKLEAYTTVYNILTNVSTIINKITDSEVKKGFVSEFVSALEIMSKDYSTSPSLNLASMLSKIVNKLNSLNISGSDIQAKTNALYTNIITSSDTLINNGTDNSALVNAVKDIINNTSVLISKNNNGSGSDMNMIVEKTLSKLGVQAVESTLNGNNASIDISNETYQNIIKCGATLSKAASDFENTLKNNNIFPNKFKKAVTLKITSKENTSNIITNLPNTLLNEISKNGVNALGISMGLANINLNTNSINTNTSEKISFNVKKLDKSKDLTPEQTSQSGLGSVYEFEASLIEKDGTRSNVRTLNQPLEVEIPYTLEEGNNPDNLSVYVYVEDEDHLENPNDKSKLNTWQAIGGKYDPNKKIIKFNRSSFSMYSIIQVNKSFGDLMKYDWAKKEIESMASKGIIAGKTPTQFDPSANITRAEFAGLIVRVLGILDTKAKVSFDDVKPGDWYYNTVASAYKAGIIQGTSSTKFEPNAPITRQEMMQITSNAMVKVLEIENNANEADLDKYVDNSLTASWARKAIALNIKLGIIKGNANLSLTPNHKTIRAEAAVIVKRLYDIM
ncbi:MAG: S-layer homology domain-containing protein [Ignavibacteriales bacterium]